MKEIDDDPNSEKAQRFRAAVDKLEEGKEMRGKKPAKTIFMTMKAGKRISMKEIEPEVEKESSLPPEEVEFQRKYLDFKVSRWPEVNGIEITRPDYKGNGSVKLQTYRYPELTDDLKGVVTFLHGYGDYSGRYAYFARKFAENGYDFNAIDQRGFGHSEGRRGVFESKEIVMDDLLTFVDKVDERYGGKDVPHFLVGQSMGGHIATMLAV